MKCEKCDRDHDGLFASGRFCSRSCANSRVFSDESRQKKSLANKERIQTKGGWGVLLLSPEKIGRTSKQAWKRKLFEDDFDSMFFDRKRKRVIAEQENQCLLCSVSEWRGVKLSLEIDHINGRRGDDRRENLRALCPNCHSICPTWRGQNKKQNKEKWTDLDVLKIFQERGNIRQTLLKMGIAAKGDNYRRVKRILRRHNLIE